MKSTIVWCVIMMMVLPCRYVTAQDDTTMPIIEQEKEITDGVVLQGPHAFWKVKINRTMARDIANCFVIHNNIIYVGLRGAQSDMKQGYLCAIAADTGALMWMFPISGVYTAPLIEGDRLYCGSYDGFLYCLSAATGEEIWKFKTDNWHERGCEFGFASDDTCLFFGYDDGFLYAVEKANGTLRWKTAVEGTLTSSPLVYNQMVYVPTSGGVIYAVAAADGNVVWRHTVQLGAFSYGFTLRNNCLSFIWCEYMLQGGRTDREKVFYTALNAATGERIYEKSWDVRAAVSAPHYVSDALLMVVGNRLEMYREDTGETIWTFETARDLYPSCLPTDRGIVVGHKGFIGVPSGSAPGTLFVLDYASGDVVWEYSVGDGLLSKLAQAQSVVYGTGVDNAASNDMNYFVFFVDMTRHQEIGRMLFSKHETVIDITIDATGCFYLRTKDALGNNFIYAVGFKN